MKSKNSLGFSLIEVMVTLLLISIGFLGMTALQIRTVKYSNETAVRTNAIMLVDELVEIIRSHPNHLNEFYKQPGVAFADKPAICSPQPSDSQDQLSCWKDKVIYSLPGARDLLKDHFYICRSDDAKIPCKSEGDALHIQVAWQNLNGECYKTETETETETENLCTYSIRTRI